MAAWLGVVVLDVLMLGYHYDVALRDTGLMLACLCLSRLGAHYER